MNTTTQSEVNDLVSAISSTIAKEMRTSLDALKQDTYDRSRIAQIAQGANDLAITNKSRVEALETRMEALLGDGTGENGKLAAMTRSQLQTQQGVEEVRGDVKLTKESLADLKAIGEQSKSALSGGKALMTTLGMLSTFFAVIGGIVGGIIWIYKH